MDYTEFEHPRPVARLGGIWVEIKRMNNEYVFSLDEDGLPAIEPITNFNDWEIPDQHVEAIAPFTNRKA